MPSVRETAPDASQQGLRLSPVSGLTPLMASGQRKSPPDPAGRRSKVPLVEDKTAWRREENHEVPFRYNITTLPTLLLFKAGAVAEQRVGLASRDGLVKLVEPHL